MSKRFVIEPVLATSLVRVRFEGGGEVPASLSGSYTTPAAAQQAIDVYLADKGRQAETVDQRLEEERANAKRSK